MSWPDLLIDDEALFIENCVDKFENSIYDYSNFISLKKTFKFNYYNFFSNNIKSILISWKKKWKGKPYFHAIDDIKFLLVSYPNEQEIILQLFNSIAIYFQKNLQINFLEIIVDDINFNKVKIENRFLNSESDNLINGESMTFTIICLIKPE